MKLKISVALLLCLLVGTCSIVTAQVADTAKLPLTLTDVVGLLKGGISPQRVATEVHERGVDFILTDEAEKQLRAAGGDDSVVIAAAKSHRTPAQQGNGIAAGTEKVNAKDGLRYVWIPAGTFQMGCSPGDNECFHDEKPAHTVTISQGFWMGQTLVTQAAYQRVRGSNPSHFHGDQLPVETVTWDDADGYCAAVGMRLPTEAEWEYAARAGDTASRYGDVDAISWYGDNSGNQRIDSKALYEQDQSNYRNKLVANGNATHAVGQKQPNGWKLYDMLGNVWEWTSDWYDKDYYSQSPSQDPRGPSSGTNRVLRGFSWSLSSGMTSGRMNVVRVSFRNRGGPGLRVSDFGFRCAGEVLSAGGDDSVVIAAAKSQRNPAQPGIGIAAGTEKVNAQAYQGRQLTAEAARSLEDQLNNNPEDLDARARLLGYYFTMAKSRIGVEATVIARRRHILWLIEHHPESQLAGLPEVTLDIAGHDLADPDGYAQARQLWVKQMGTKDVQVLRNIAFFFKVPDKALAENALLRWRALEPASPEVTAQLAFLYSMAILGVDRMSNTGIPTGWNAGAASTDFAHAIREKLEKSSDADLVAAVARMVQMQSMMLHVFAKDFPTAEYDSFSERLILRARDLAPGKYSSALGDFYARKAMATASPEERLTLQKKALALQEQALDRMTERPAPALEQMATLALDVDETAKAGKYAQELLDQASAIQDAKMHGQLLHKANILLGRVELRNGDVAAAKKRLLAAGRVNDGVTLSSFGPNMSLAKDLLEKGERDVVLQYLDLCARFWTSDRGQLAKWKAEIQAGSVPNFGANLSY